MKSNFSKIFYLAAAIILPLCLIGVLTSAFKIEIIPWMLTFSLIPALTFAVLEITDSCKRLFWGAAFVYSVVFVAVVYFKFDSLISQINYAVNCILKYYAAAYPIVTSVNLTKTISRDAGFLAAMLCVLLSGVFTVCLLRLRRYLPVLLLSLIFLVPCFIVVNSTPNALFTVSAVAILIALYVTIFLRRHNSVASGYVFVAASVVILCASIIICSIFPQENYERYAWQDSVLYNFEAMTGIRNTGGLGQLAMMRDDIQSTISLENQGNMTQKHIKVMRVLSEKGGRLYLKGVSYSNYENNSWSVLSAEQEQNLPEKMKPFTSDIEEQDEISIITEEKSAVAYYPYYMKSVPEKLNSLDDVLLKNKDKVFSYNFKAGRLADSEKYEFSSNTDYEEYAAQNYTVLPQKTRDALLKLARSDEKLSACMDGEVDEIVRAVKEFVSSKGYYNLNCGKMPAGEDFPVWFLSDAESGYCVHYASAATAMLRALGVPARYVSGYILDAEQGEWTTVTSDNAHAWAEVYDSEYGWRPVEATPPSFSPAQYIPEQATTQNAAESETNPVSAPVETQPTSPRNSNEKHSALGLNIKITIAVSAAVLLFVLIILLRVLIINRLRLNRMNRGGLKSRVIHTYRYIERLDKYKKSPIPEEIEEIALKVKFSEHGAVMNDVRVLRTYALRARRELYSNSNLPRRLYLRFVAVV